MTGQSDFIPFNGIRRQAEFLKHELMFEVERVVSSGQYLHGPNLNKFEDTMAQLCNREYAIAVNSGTNAMHYIFDYLQHSRENDWSLPRENGQVKPMQIAVPNFSFKSTINVVQKRGSIYQIDVNEYSGLLEPRSLFTDSVLDVVMYTNLYGNMMDYSELVTVMELFLKDDNPIIIEDAAQSFGSTYHGKPSGSFGDFSLFSFDPTKPLASLGGGGMILTDNAVAATWLWEYLRNGKPTMDCGRVNSVMSEIDCASAILQLKYVDYWKHRRTAIAEYYNENIDKSICTPDQTITEGVDPNWHKYVIHTDKRNMIARHLEEQQIETRIHYNMDKPWTSNDMNYTGARMMGTHVLSLPIYPELTDSEVERIVQEVNKAAKKSLPIVPSVSVTVIDD